MPSSETLSAFRGEKAKLEEDEDEDYNDANQSTLAVVGDSDEEENLSSVSQDKKNCQTFLNRISFGKGRGRMKIPNEWH